VDKSEKLVVILPSWYPGISRGIIGGNAFSRFKR